MSSFTVGQAVKFTTPGRHPRERSGTISSIAAGFAVIDLGDGKTIKARPGTLRGA